MTFVKLAAPRRAQRVLATALVAGLLLLASRATAQVPDTNLGLAIRNGVPVDSLLVTAPGSDLVAFIVDEESQGRADLSGDGLIGDQALHVFDAARDETTNLQFPAARVVIDGQRVVFAVSEAAIGADRNDDRDTADFVPQIFDAATGVTTDLGIATVSVAPNMFGVPVAVAAPAYQVSGNFLVLLALEQSGDLNGDGDNDDAIPRVFDTAAKRMRVLPLAAVGNAAASGAHALIAVSEAGQGEDLNGDGDTLDVVPHVVELASGAVTNLRVAAADTVLQGELVVTLVSEAAQGNADRNGDGDALDAVLSVFDTATGEATDVGLAPAQIDVAGKLVAFLVREQGSDGSGDLNRDRDLDDFVVHVFDASSGRTVNTRTAIVAPTANVRAPLKVSAGAVAWSVHEDGQGVADLDGDGDTRDGVLHVFDPTTGETLNVGAALGAFEVSGRRVAFTTDSIVQVFDLEDRMTRDSGLNGASLRFDGDVVGFTANERALDRDLNDDGDASNLVIDVLDAASGTSTALLDTTEAPIVQSGRVAFLATEQRQGTPDLNGDGDLADSVLQLFDTASGQTLNLGHSAALAAVQLRDRVLAFVVVERADGRDLNGDGDTDDRVVHVLRLGAP